MKRLHQKHRYSGIVNRNKSKAGLQRFYGAAVSSRSQAWDRTPGKRKAESPKQVPVKLEEPPVLKSYARMTMNTIVEATRPCVKKKIAKNKIEDTSEHSPGNTVPKDENPDNTSNGAVPGNLDIKPEQHQTSSGKNSRGIKKPAEKIAVEICKESSDIKPTGGTCQGCMATVKNVRSMLEESEYHVDGHNYVQLFWDCFNLEVGSFCPEEIPLICTYCVNKLNVAWLFRSLVEHTQAKMKSMELKEEIRYEDIDYEVANDNQHVSIDGLNLENYEHTEEENCSGSKFQSNSRPSVADKYVEDRDSEAEYNFDPICEPNFDTKKEKKEVDYFECYIKELNRKSLTHKVIRNENELHGIKKNAKKCTECKMVFKSYPKLLKHLSTHFPNHVCSVCGDVFFNKQQLYNHTKTKHLISKKTCTLCFESIIKTDMSIHMQLVHNSKGIYICDCCDYSFSYRNALMMHLKMKTNTFRFVRFVCKICRKDFSSKHGLNRHMLKHTGKREFVCQVCNKGFLKKDTLTAHMKIHCDVKDFICGVCSKEFTYKCSLKVHVEKYHPEFNQIK